MVSLGRLGRKDVSFMKNQRSALYLHGMAVDLRLNHMVQETVPRLRNQHTIWTAASSPWNSIGKAEAGALERKPF